MTDSKSVLCLVTLCAQPGDRERNGSAGMAPPVDLD